MLIIKLLHFKVNISLLLKLHVYKQHFFLNLVNLDYHLTIYITCNNYSARKTINKHFMNTIYFMIYIYR